MFPNFFHLQDIKAMYSSCVFIKAKPWNTWWQTLFCFLSFFSGLVVYFSVDTDPVLCEQKRKTLASSNHPDNSSKIYKAK